MFVYYFYLGISLFGYAFNITILVLVFIYSIYSNLNLDFNLNFKTRKLYIKSSDLNLKAMMIKKGYGLLCRKVKTSILKDLTKLQDVCTNLLVV